MNYTDYIDSLQPGHELKEQTGNKVQAAIVNKRKRARQRKLFTISAAACFAVLMISATGYHSLNSDVYLTGDQSVAMTESIPLSVKVPDEKIVVCAAGNDNEKGNISFVVIDDKVYGIIHDWLASK